MFDNVTLKYNENAAPAIKNASFTVEKGETVGVIGGTGSGKTSLVSLLPHFYDVSEGGVYLGGKNVAAYAPEELREKIAVVPQKAVLFKGTVRSNLAWGDKEAALSDDAAWAALKCAQADDVVKQKGGLDAWWNRAAATFRAGRNSV